MTAIATLIVAAMAAALAVALLMQTKEYREVRLGCWLTDLPVAFALWRARRLNAASDRAWRQFHRIAAAADAYHEAVEESGAHKSGEPRYSQA